MPKASASKSKNDPIEAGRHPGAKALLSMRKNQCLWPHGDPRDKNFRFCGKPIVPGHSYCEEHLKLSLTDKTFKKMAGQK